MVGRAEEVTAGCTVAEGLVAAGAVGSRGRVAAGAVETAEVSRARGCGAGGATKVARLAKPGCRAAGATEVARLAEAGSCRAAGATEVAKLAGARGCYAAGATKVVGLTGAGCWAESPEMKEVWTRSATAMVAAVECFWASREARRVSRSGRIRVVSSSPVRAVAEFRSRAVNFSRRGIISRSCSAFATSNACLSAVVLAM